VGNGGGSSSNLLWGKKRPIRPFMGMMEVAGEQTEAGPQASAYLLYMTLISVLTQRQVNMYYDGYLHRASGTVPILWQILLYVVTGERFSIF
jgi:hypothetical protein